MPLPAKHHQVKSSIQPFNPQRDLLKAAGYGEPEQLELVRRIVESASQELEATKQTPLTDHGELLGTFEQPDYGARAKARDQLISIIGLAAKGHSGDGNTNPPALPPPLWLQVNVGKQADSTPATTAQVVDSPSVNHNPSLPSDPA